MTNLDKSVNVEVGNVTIIGMRHMDSIIIQRVTKEGEDNPIGFQSFLYPYNPNLVDGCIPGTATYYPETNTITLHINDIGRYTIDADDFDQEFNKILEIIFTNALTAAAKSVLEGTDGIITSARKTDILTALGNELEEVLVVSGDIKDKCLTEMGNAIEING